MRFDLVAAWVLSLPTVAGAREAATSPSGLGPTIRDSAIPHVTPAVDALWPVVETQDDSHDRNLPEVHVEDLTAPVIGKDLLLQLAEAYKSRSDSVDCDNARASLDPSTSQSEPTGGSNPGLHAVDPIVLKVVDLAQKTNHIVEVDFTSYCPPSTADADLGIETIEGHVNVVDGKKLNPPSSFHVKYDRRNDYVVDVVGGWRLFIELDDGTGNPLFEHSSIVNDLVESQHFPGFRDDQGDVESSDRAFVDANAPQEQADPIEEAVRILKYGEAELQSLQDRLGKQRKVIDRLTAGRYTIENGSFRDCDTVTCVLKKLIHESKACIHSLYQRLSTFVRQKKEDCSTMASATSKKQVNFMGSPSRASQACAEKTRPDTKDYTLLPEIKEESSSDESDDDSSSTFTGTTFNQTRSAFSETPIRQSYTTTHKVHAALGVALSALCLGCLTTFLHRRCCNPRAKADRAARREERRNQREYARAARQHAWRDWWAKRIGLGPCLCCGGRKDRRIADYEEKRALIMQQEDRLETAQQVEIRYLADAAAEEEGRAGYGNRISIPSTARRSMYEASERRRHRHTTRQTRANTGGSDSSNAATLPSYRSRDSSGSRTRPPSYRTRASSIAHPAPASENEESLVARIVDGFPHVRAGHETHDWQLSDDETPDSSVVDVSPRMSSETLRTELSVL